MVISWLVQAVEAILIGVRDWWSSRRPNVRYSTILVEDELPRRLSGRRLYIVVEAEFQELAVLTCPCRCGAILYLNLNPDDRPCWRVQLDADGTTSIEPSIRRLVGCRSHFWFRSGHIEWVTTPAPGKL
ncbi:MAG: DUF6527 family protein [Vulcanimicrobiota bacterium]